MAILVSCASVGMILAMSFAVYAARPTNWYYPGGTPESWLGDIANNKQKIVRLQELAADYNMRITFNEKLMARNAQALYLSGLVSVATLGLSLVSLVIHQTC